MGKAMGFGILFYLLLYLLIYTIILFYAHKYSIIGDKALEDSRTYKYIISWGMKAIDRLRGFFP
jgi:membrane protein required for colicin V production